MKKRYLLLFAFGLLSGNIVLSMQKSPSRRLEKVKSKKLTKPKDHYNAVVLLTSLKEQIRFCNKLSPNEQKKLQDYAKKKNNREVSEIITKLKIKNLQTRFRSSSIGQEYTTKTEKPNLLKRALSTAPRKRKTHTLESSKTSD